MEQLKLRHEPDEHKSVENQKVRETDQVAMHWDLPCGSGVFGGNHWGDTL